MHSIRSKITVMTVSAIVIVMTLIAISGIIEIRNITTRSAERSLLLLCETGEKNLDQYFRSVEQSVEMVSAYVESDLSEMEKLDDKSLAEHMDRVDGIFHRLTYKTYGVCTYYYRIDPEISRKVKGFWYVNVDGSGFKEHKVTDLTKYGDGSDEAGLVWFTVPKKTGDTVWLPPYITENLDVRVISYNVPVYYDRAFIGVIGIEMDYSTMAEQVDNIRLYDSGYAFLNDNDGKIVYHPQADVMERADTIKAPAGMLGSDKFITYKFNGVEKMAVWLPLENGMRLNVAVPVSEVNEEWIRWSVRVLILLAILLAIFIAIIMKFTGRITQPLMDLAGAAKKIDEGDYDVELTYDGDDEVGALTRTFDHMRVHLKSYISDLSDLAYADALTSVHNRGAFDIYMKNLQDKLVEAGGDLEFAICMFDCNRLKQLNDQLGHDKGDLYLKETSKAICDVFQHCPVFRIGGDEFATVLQDRCYRSREKLIERFDEFCEEKRATESEPWRKIDVSHGLAIFDPVNDNNVSDVVRRADKLMYENKWSSRS